MIEFCGTLPVSTLEMEDDAHNDSSGLLWGKGTWSISVHFNSPLGSCRWNWNILWTNGRKRCIRMSMSVLSLSLDRGRSSVRTVGAISFRFQVRLQCRGICCTGSWQSTGVCVAVSMTSSGWQKSRHVNTWSCLGTTFYILLIRNRRFDIVQTKWWWGHTLL